MRNLPNKQVGLIAVGVSVFLVVVWWFAIMSPVSHKLATNQQAQAAAEQQKQKLQSQIVQLKAIANEQPQDEAKLGTLTQQVPDNPQLDIALNDLQSSATSAGVTLTSITPSSPSSQSAQPARSASNSQTASAAPAISVGVTAQGDYAGLRQFVKNLESQPRTFVLTNVGISGQDPKLVGQLSVSIFYAGQPTP